MTRRTIAVAVATAAVWVAAATAAWAHPGFRPSTAPAGETVSAELVIPHSCGAEGMPEDEEDQSPTSLVDVQVPAGVTITPHDKDGWTLETTEQGFMYTASNPTETTIIFELELAVTGDEGDVHHVGIYQECVDGGSFSWIGTPDNEAEHPAAVLTVGQAASENGSETEPSEAPTDGETDTTSDGVTDESTAEITGDEVAVDDLDDDGGNAGAIALVGGAVALAVGAGAFLLRRRMLGGPEA